MKWFKCIFSPISFPCGSLLLTYQGIYYLSDSQLTLLSSKVCNFPYQILSANGKIMPKCKCPKGFHSLAVTASSRRADYFNIWIFELDTPWIWISVIPFTLTLCFFNIRMCVNHLKLFLKCGFLFSHLRWTWVSLHLQVPRWCCVY